MIYGFIATALGCGLIGFLLGYRIRAKYDGAAWEMVARFKTENDQMIERLTELEEALQEAENE